MRKGNKTLSELHQIRAELYNELRNLSIEERLKRLCESGQSVIKKRGLKLKRSQRLKASA